MLLLIVYVLIGGLVGVLINILADLLPRTRMLTNVTCSNCSDVLRPVDGIFRSKCQRCGNKFNAETKSALQSRVFALECPHCSTPYTLKGYFISFRCQQCGKRPGLRKIMVLALSIAASVLVGIYPLGELSFWLTIPILLFFGIILVIDIEHHVILTETSLVGLVLLFVYGWHMQGLLITSIGGLSGFLIMLLIYVFGIFFSRIMAKSRKEDSAEPGLGFGDVYAAAFLGFFVGWPYSLGMIILAILLSGIYSFIYLTIKAINRKYQAYATIPYAPFLVLATIMIFYLPPIPNL